MSRKTLSWRGRPGLFEQSPTHVVDDLNGVNTKIVVDGRFVGFLFDP